MVRHTRLSVCRRKQRHATQAAAIVAAVAGGWLQRPYRCDQCQGFHLTSRRQGGWIPRVIRDAARRASSSSPAEERL